MLFGLFEDRSAFLCYLTLVGVCLAAAHDVGWWAIPVGMLVLLLVSGALQRHRAFVADNPMIAGKRTLPLWIVAHSANNGLFAILAYVFGLGVGALVLR